MAVPKKPTEIEVPELHREVVDFCILGETPLIFNRMAEKAKRELLLPAGKKSTAQKKTSLKHDPLAEYRASVYFSDNDEDETYLGFPAPGFKKAIAEAALSVPGATKKDIGKLVRIHSYRVPIYGVPQIFTTGVRSADMNRTPDMRTRAILPRWACKLQVSYVTPLLNHVAVSNLLSAAGQIIGVGDFRQEKGAGDHGLFELVKPDDKRFLNVINSGGREEQMLALKDPEFFDEETRELLTWYEEEIVRRGMSKDSGEEVVEAETETKATKAKSKK